MEKIYLRKETVYVDLNGYPQAIQAVCYYKDKDAKQKLCANKNADKPTRRNKYVMYNCSRYPVQWLEDKV